jgi:signal peptidase II
MTLQNRIFLLLVLMTVCVGCDQATKRLAAFALKDMRALSFLGNTFRLEYAENPGAFLSLGSTLPDTARFLLLTVVSGGVLLALAAFVCLRRNIRISDFTGYALILAGGLSNLLDRVVAGFVIDFMNIGVGTVRTGIFNVADVAIMGGLALVAWGQLRPEPDSTGSAAQPS